MSFPYTEIEARLGYAFRDKSLLKQAFTHSSYAHVFHEKDNERLEYLGDSVLQLVVTEWQYERDERTEGKLTAMRQRLVCRQALDSAIDALDVYRYLLVSGSEQNLSDKTKADLFEAITAAIYLDGGYRAAKTFILKHGNVEMQVGQRNYKGELQEYLQARGKELPKYRYEKSGKDHAPVFVCTVEAIGESAEAHGKSVREAESLAASRLLWELYNKYGK